MRISGDRMAARAGVTLVEVMLAGALTAISVLVTLEAFIVAGKIAHENAETLRADNIAFDLLWRKFYGDYEQLSSNVNKPVQDRAAWKTASPYHMPNDNLASNESEYPQYKYREYVDNRNDGGAVLDGGLRLTIRLYPKLDDNESISSKEEQHILRELTVFRSNIPRTSN